MGYFHVELTFPSRMLNEEIAQHLKDKEYYDSGKADYKDKVSLLENCYTDNTENFIMIEAEDTHDGKIEDLEKLLNKYNVPYDRSCGADDGFAADDTYVRPGKEDHTVKLSEGEEYIKIDDVVKVLDLPDHLLRIEIEKLVDENSSVNVEPLDNFLAETEIGRNPEAMGSIEEVLAKLDAGEITEEAAFEQLKLLKVVTPHGQK